MLIVIQYHFDKELDIIATIKLLLSSSFHKSSNERNAFNRMVTVVVD